MWGEDDPFVLNRLEGISTRPILSVANYISLDADCIVAGSTDRSIRFYETQTMDEVMKTTMEKKNVSIVAVSGMGPEGDDPIIVTGGKDSIIQVWNPTENTPQKVIKLPTSEVKALAVYQGSRTLIVIGTRDAKVLVWDVDDNRMICAFEGHRASIYCVCITVTVQDFDYMDDDMKYLCIASGSADRTVRTWDLVRKKRIKKFRHLRSISSVVVTNRGIRPLLASAGVERVVKIWDLDSGILLRCLGGHLDQINTMTLWEGNQMFIISGSADHTIRIFDMISGECICILKGHRDAVLSLTTADYDQPKIVSCSEDLSIIQWDLDAIIEAFYDNSEEGEGARTSLPAYLPPVEYVAPIELDRSQLSKEERKKIRKERKRAKRLRNLQSFTASSKPGRNNEDEDDDDDNENYGSFVFDDDDEDDDKEPTEPMISIPDAIKEAIAAVERGDSKYDQEISQAELTHASSKSSLMLRVGSNKVLPDHHLQPSTGDHHQQQAAGGLIKGIWNRVFHSGHNKIGVEPTDEENGVDTSPSTANISQDSSNGLQHMATTASSREEEEEEIAGEGGGTRPIVDKINPQEGEEREPSTSLAHRPSQSSTPLKPLVVGEDSGRNMVEYKSITKMKQESFSMAVADHMRETDRMKFQASEKLRNRLIMKQMKNGGNAGSGNATPGPFSPAGSAVDTPVGLLSPAAGTPQDASLLPAEEDTGEQTDAVSKAEFMKVKAEKLRQHKMQEQRRKESMMVSKNRSGLALQKRLEDLKNKRQQQQDGSGNNSTSNNASKPGMEDVFEMADDSEDEDEDGDNNSDK